MISNSPLAFITLVRQVSENIGTDVEGLEILEGGFSGRTVAGISFEGKLEQIDDQALRVTMEYLGIPYSWEIKP